jgi:signal transduction histidine kinase
MEPMPRWRIGDLVVAVTLVFAMVLAALLGRQVPLGTRAAAVAAAAGLLVLVVRRRRPVAALAGVMAVVLAEDVLSARAASAPSFLALMVATYSLGRYASRRSAAVAFPLAAGGVVLAQSLSPPTQFSRASSMTFFVAILVLAPGVTGAVVRVRADLGERLRVAADRLREARAAQIAGAVAREHDRISLDLETVMVRGLDQMRGPAAARDLPEVTQLEHVARETLAQMRGLLVRLRADEHPGPQLDRSVPDLRARIAAALTADAASPRSPVGAPGRWTLWSARQGDWALAALGCALAAALAATRPWPGPALLGAAIALPLAWLRRFPFTAGGLSLAAFVGFSIVARPADPFTGQPPTAVLIVIPLVTAAVCPLPRAVTALLSCLAGGAIAVLADPAARFHVLTAPTAAAVAAGAWAAGRVLHQAGQTLAALTDTTRQIEQEQADSARRNAARERARIARELHDAVGHALTIIVMQATAARRVWTSAPDLAHDHATVLRDTTAQTLDDLYLLVLSLAIGGPQTTPDPEHAVAALTRAPRGPQLADRIAVLADRARACGIPVEIRTEGQASPPAPVLDQAAYRIVQEAVTNAARHAPGGAVRVSISHTADRATLQIANDPASRPAHTLTGSGHGIRGMRERAAECGGTLHAEPGRDGSFTVRAVLHRQTSPVAAPGPPAVEPSAMTAEPVQEVQ